MWFLKLGLKLLLAVIVAGGLFLYFSPPELIRVGANYTAKIVCSNVFIAGRDPSEVLAIDVQAPGHPLLTIMRVSVDESEGTVRTGLFGWIGGGLARHRTGQGCAVLPGGLATDERSEVSAAPGIETTDAAWPKGNPAEPATDEHLQTVLADQALAGPGMRAIVIIKDGTLIAERYGEGFDQKTPLLGWSTTKTVTAALIGRAIREGRMTLDDAPGLVGWAGDGRSDVSVTDLMGMASDLRWNEGYGSVSDVTRMLFLVPYMAGFAAGQTIDDETPGQSGEVFDYSSGTTVLLSRIWQNAFDAPEAGLAFPRQSLFEPLGMTSAVLETDARGTFVGSSYLYATARDWARFGQFLLQRGVWEGRSLLPVGYVDWMTDPHPASDGQYGRGQVWLRPANAWLPGENPELPDDAFFMNGHDGQSVNIIPSEGLVIVRLGLTPTDRGYKVAHLIRAVIGATAE